MLTDAGCSREREQPQFREHLNILPNGCCGDANFLTNNQETPKRWRDRAGIRKWRRVQASLLCSLVGWPQLSKLAPYWTRSTLHKWGTAGIFTLFGAGRRAALFDLLERTKRISPLSQPWESRMLLMTPCAHLIRRAWLPRRDSRPQRRANRARILNVELRGSKWHPRRISRPIGPT